MPSIPVGLKHEFRRQVTDEIAINFMGIDGARVLGTPFLIMLLEMTARNSILPLLDPGYDSVGTEVNVRHLAATPIGMEITLRSEVTNVNDRRVRFRVEAFDEKEQIGDGAHERAVINVERFARRLADKKNNKT